MDVNSLRENLSNKIDISNRNVLVFGAGNTSLLYASCFKNENIDIKAFIDNNPDKIGKTFLGKNIISVSEIDSYENPVILVSSTNVKTFKEITLYLDGKNYENYLIDEYVYKKNSENIMNIFDSWNDDKSKEVYADMILSRMGRKTMNLDLVSSGQYFEINEFSQINADEVFVDCGAYVGDTIETYLHVKEGIFGKIYAFEPDIKNFNAMKYRVERLNNEWALSDQKINLINAGVGQHTSKMLLNDCSADGPALGASFSHESFDENGICVYALDDYFGEQKVSFIKADIEGFEESMLRGAEKIIKKDKPLIAVCIYHNASDMYRIPLLIKEFNPEYKISLRQHRGNLSETVLYAY